MFKFLKRSAKSRTTQNVVAAGGTVAAVLAFIRAMWPDLLPWPVDADVTAAAALTAILGRLMAVLRTPEKAGADLVALDPPADS